MDANYDLKGSNHTLISCFAGSGPAWVDEGDPEVTTDNINVRTRHGIKAWGDNMVLKNCVLTGNAKQFFVAYNGTTTGRTFRLERCTLFCDTQDQVGSYVEYTGNTVVMQDCVIAYADYGSAYVADAGTSVHQSINTLRVRYTSTITNSPYFKAPVVATSTTAWNGLGTNFDNGAVTPSGGVGYNSNIDIISYNLSTTTEALTNHDFVGYAPVINWVTSTANNQTLSNVRNAGGVSTTADITSSNTAYPYANNTAVQAWPMDDDTKLMRNQRGLSNAPTMSVTAVQVPYATYDVYVYWGGRTPTEAASAMTVEFQQLNAGTYTTTATKWIRDANFVWDGTYNESLATSAATAVDGQEFVVFRDVTAPQFRIRATAGNRSGISGLQIVKK